MMNKIKFRKTPVVAIILTVLCGLLILPTYFAPHEFSVFLISGLIMETLAIVLIIVRRGSLFWIAVALIVIAVLSAILISAQRVKREYAFWIAIVKADVPEIKRLISKGYGVNAQSPFGTSLLTAFHYGYNRGVFFHRTKRFQESPQQIEEKILKVLEVLIDNGADDINGVDNWNNSPLRFAVQDNQIRIVELLIKKGANVNQIEGITHKRTPLKAAIEMGHTEIAELLRRHGAKEEVK